MIITKARQLYQARKMSKKFYAAYRATRDPLEIFKREEEFPGAPAFEGSHFTGAEELVYHLQEQPGQVEKRTRVTNAALGSLKGPAPLIFWPVRSPPKSVPRLLRR